MGDRANILFMGAELEIANRPLQTPLVDGSAPAITAPAPEPPEPGPGPARHRGAGNRLFRAARGARDVFHGWKDRIKMLSDHPLEIIFAPF